MFSKPWERWVPLASLAQTSWAKHGCLPVCLHRVIRTLAESRDTPKTVLEESFTNLLEPQWGHYCFFFFHVVWRDNLDILTLEPVSPKIFKSKSPLVPGCIAEGPWYPTARCAGDRPSVPARAPRAEGRREIRLYP